MVVRVTSRYFFLDIFIFDALSKGEFVLFSTVFIKLFCLYVIICQPVLYERRTLYICSGSVLRIDVVVYIINILRYHAPNFVGVFYISAVQFVVIIHYLCRLEM